MDLAEVKGKCSTLERCLPIGSGYRVELAKLHNEMIDEITALRSQLSIVEGEKALIAQARDAAMELAGVEMALKEKAESERDTWLAAHDAIYAELQTEKAERAADRDLMWRLQAAYERGKGETAEATRLQKKAEMLLESSERCRATLEEELLLVKGERDRAFTAGGMFGWEACENNWQEDDYERHAAEARAALHPATESPKWVIHLIGPDDVIDQPDELTALREANKLNIGLARRRAEDPSDNDPHCWAVVKDVSVESV